MTTEINERRWRLLRFGTELSRRGVPYRLSRPPNGRWRLRVRSSHERMTVFCAGTEGIYVLVTAEGRILGAADPSGTRHAADQLTAFSRQRLRPAQHRWAS